MENYPLKTDNDLEWLQLSLAAFVFLLNTHIQRKPSGNWNSEEILLMVDNWLKGTRILISVKAESKHTLPSGFSLDVWADREQRSHQEHSVRLMVRTSMHVPFLFLHALNFQGWYAPCYCGLKCFRGDFLERVPHIQGKLQNQQYSDKQKFIYW